MKNYTEKVRRIHDLTTEIAQETLENCDSFTKRELIVALDCQAWATLCAVQLIEDLEEKAGKDYFEADEI